MRYTGWCYSFIIKPKIPFWDGCFEISDILTKHKVRGCYVSVIEDDKEYWRVLLFDTTRNKADKICDALKGRRLRVLDNHTVDVLMDFIEG